MFLKQYRENNRIPVHLVAGLAGISVEMLERYECGEAALPERTAQRILRAIQRLRGG